MKEAFSKAMLQTETADIDYLLNQLGHGPGTLFQRGIVKGFRDQVALLALMETIKIRKGAS